MQSEQKSEEKASLTMLPHVSRPVPDEKGETKNVYKVQCIFPWKETSYTKRESLLQKLIRSSSCYVPKDTTKKFKIPYLCDP